MNPTRIWVARQLVFPSQCACAIAPRTGPPRIRAVTKVLALERLSERRRPLEDLTPREFDVLCMLVAPINAHEIAKRLHLSVKTVHNPNYQIKTKLGVDSDIELARLALSWGLDLLPVFQQGRR